MITLAQLEDFFAETRQTRDSGRANWNIDEECRWSYFFVDADRLKLLPIAEHLGLAGYQFVGTLDPDESDEDPVFFLRLDRVETHSPASLDRRNQQLYGIAAEFGVSSYDGFDVGAVDGP
ncbi:ribonuclease E inhibitor RraB [Pseudoduganella albidiflava]|uniref:Ribonuclease E inhibitor RraB n=1 Tax=Pseudoduganella albidiflava TaxID=321983 RepID=A0A411WXG4_9BURK|nr:ribonuclease E inhibitor RraB [Pseudoduganella albidiflava]QBI01322.1 ribonuclease E inhibitor RraB [Pseudoduganella albidiflava]GGY36600.1 hypothetical protein GCM10007387_18670 [Pseudoduganella albidiflava]